MRRPDPIGRAIGPLVGLLHVTQGVALGWYVGGPLALKTRQAAQSQTRICFHASRPDSAPTAQLDTSMGHRPRINATKFLRAEGPLHFPPMPTSKPTDNNQKQLGKTLWAIADQLRGAMKPDDFRDYMPSCAASQFSF